MKPLSVAAALIPAALIVVAGVARADEPGPGGTKAPVPVTGEQIYRHVCQSCHMADAKGATGAATIPALARDAKLAEPGYPIVMVANGHGAMPWFSDALTPKQIADVLNYVRTHFGNAYRDTIKPSDVSDVANPPPKPER